ncbi:hypothetical protein [Wolbachia endosymbiont (group A) of Clivina fossor]|uniref:hypothetical protein n=1 Tax=Wolbachia endosymbiont (group A) of Clivina fossor TaxID=3066133 RepID=UPI00313305E6
MLKLFYFRNFSLFVYLFLGIGISLGDKEYAIVKDHMIEIPREVSHRIENRSTSSPLEIVEFQIGEHLSDNDIVRLDDVYGRF